MCTQQVLLYITSALRINRQLLPFYLNTFDFIIHELHHRLIRDDEYTVVLAKEDEPVTNVPKLEHVPKLKTCRCDECFATALELLLSQVLLAPSWQEEWDKILETPQSVVNYIDIYEDTTILRHAIIAVGRRFLVSKADSTMSSVHTLIHNVNAPDDFKNRVISWDDFKQVHGEHCKPRFDEHCDKETGKLSKVKYIEKWVRGNEDETNNHYGELSFDGDEMLLNIHIASTITHAIREQDSATAKTPTEQAVERVEAMQFAQGSTFELLHERCHSIQKFMLAQATALTVEQSKALTALTEDFKATIKDIHSVSARTKQRFEQQSTLTVFICFM